MNSIKDHTNVYYYIPSHLHYFMNARCIWIDATFRVCLGLRSKWRQCLIISARVTIDGSSRYLPIFAVLMKNKQKSNYRKVFSHLKNNVLKDLGRPKGRVWILLSNFFWNFLFFDITRFLEPLKVNKVHELTQNWVLNKTTVKKKISFFREVDP